tara:strand:- start:3142 stop:3843 length:702 start_codon:yes stop_codon:yes gene_type:complete
MNCLINYADLAFEKSRHKNSISGILAGFDSVIQYKKKNIDRLFFEKHKNILTKKRGAGYWLWKPYFICAALTRLKEDDIVFYSDAGAEFIKPIEPLLDLIKEKGIVGFKMSGNHKEGEYTRRSVISSLGMDPDVISKTNQCMASFIGVRNCSRTKKIIREWLSYCSDENLLMDKEREENEFKEFIDHRHDQSLWSLITKKLNIYKAADPTQWGANSGESKPEEFFINHHRSKE